MYLFEQFPSYNPNDSTFSGFRYKKNRILCDYTGEIFPLDDVDKPQYSIKFDYNHDCEPEWYEDDIKEILKHYPDIEKYDIMSYLFEDQEFHFASDCITWIDATFSLNKEWSNTLNKKSSIFYQCKTFAQACRVSRIRVLTDLLKNNTLKPEDLGFSN